MYGLEDRVDKAERRIRRYHTAPTIPIYDPSALPQDAVIGQIALGTDSSFNWYDGSWHTQAAAASTFGSVPQDAIEGQIAIGSDGTFHWYVNGEWRTGENGAAASSFGAVPQDTVTAQIAIGTDGTFHWYDGFNWQTFA